MRSGCLLVVVVEAIAVFMKLWELELRKCVVKAIEANLCA